MRQRTWPSAAKIRNWTLAITAHSRGDAGSGGHYRFERGAGARWAGRIDVPPMAATDAVAFRAFLHSLRGKSGSFNLTPPPRRQDDTCTASRSGGKARFSDCTGFSDGTQFSDPWAAVFSLSGTLTADAAAGADSVTLSSVAGLAVGDYIVIGGQLLRAVSVAGSTVGIRPRLRVAAASGAAFTAGEVAAEFRIVQDAPIVPLVNGRSLDVQLDIEEFY